MTYEFIKNLKYWMILKDKYNSIKLILW